MKKKATPWLMALRGTNPKGYADIPIKRGKFKLRIPDHTLASGMHGGEVCDYHDGKGYQLETLVFNFRINSAGKFITKRTDLPADSYAAAKDEYLSGNTIHEINMYHLSQDVDVDDKFAAERAKIYRDPKRYEPAYRMKHYPLIYYPNMNYDNHWKKISDENYYKYYPVLVGIIGTIDDSSGLPMLMDCRIYNHLIKDEERKEVVQESVLDSDLTIENSLGDARLGRTCWGGDTL